MPTSSIRRAGINLKKGIFPARCRSWYKIRFCCVSSLRMRAYVGALGRLSGASRRPRPIRSVPSVGAHIVRPRAATWDRPFIVASSISFASSWRRKLAHSAAPTLPTRPGAQPLAALPPYGCGLPPAGTSLGSRGDPKIFNSQFSIPNSSFLTPNFNSYLISPI